MSFRVHAEQALIGVSREAIDKHKSHLLSTIAGWLHILDLACLLLGTSFGGCLYIYIYIYNYLQRTSLYAITVMHDPIIG